jgi:excisionase family DNA binding protein
MRKNKMGTKALEALYSVQAAAKKLGGVSKFTIYAWLSRGLLEKTKVGGRTMIRESSLLKLVEESSKRGKRGK